MENTLRENRKVFSRVGWGFAALLALALGIQMLLVLLLGALAPGFSNSPWYLWVIGNLPMYCVGVPVCILIVRTAPRVYIRDHALGAGTLLVCFTFCYTIMYAGNLLGTGLSSLLGLLRGRAVTNPVLDLIGGQNLWITALFVVILAPFIEEFLCRKLIIDRLAPFGDKTAILVSALVFGLIHGNFQQFFYAFGIGLVFGYVYIRSGRLRYSIGMHMILNFMGSVLPLLLLGDVDIDAMLEFSGDPAELEAMFALLPRLMTLLGYVVLVFALWVTGLVLFLVFRKRTTLYPGEYDLRGRRFATVALNPGMSVFFVLSLTVFFLNTFL